MKVFKVTYRIWEAWLYLSLIWFLSMFVVGTMLGSVQMFPNWDVGFGFCVANLVACVFVGLKGKSY